MSNLESTRGGWFSRGLGVFFMLLAIGLVAWDVVAGNPIWPLNIITFGAGTVTFYYGTKQIRNAREHQHFMERHRAEMARLNRT